MAKKGEIILEIRPDGKITLEVKGVPGKKCLDFTKSLEEELGVVLERERTAEYYQQVEEERIKTEVKD